MLTRGALVEVSHELGSVEVCRGALGRGGRLEHPSGAGHCLCAAHLMAQKAVAQYQVAHSGNCTVDTHP